MSRELKNLTAVPEAKRRRMTKFETTIFVLCQMRQGADGTQFPAPEPVLPNDLADAILATDLFKPELLQLFPMQVLLKRLQVFTPGTLYDPLLIAFLGASCDRPGWSVLWAYTVFKRTQELGRPYTLSDWTDDFPNGPPSDEGAGEIWDAQKWSRELDGERSAQQSDNVLDRTWPWQVAQPVAA